MDDADIGRELREAQRELAEFATRYENYTSRRNQAIRRAIAAGWTARRIGETLGLSVQRVHKIARRVALGEEEGRVAAENGEARHRIDGPRYGH